MYDYIPRETDSQGQLFRDELKRILGPIILECRHIFLRVR